MKITIDTPLTLRENEVFRYLASPRTDTLAEDVRRLGAELLSAARPAACAVRLPLILRQDGPAAFSGCPLVLPGEDARRRLAGCGEAVLLAVTLGFGVDRLIGAAGQTDPYRALVLDALATEAVEAAADEAIRRMPALGLIPPGLRAGQRFSPGYGDLPLEIQGAFLDAVDARRMIGLSVGGTNMLSPLKSVTAVIGLFPEGAAEPAASGCGGSSGGRCASCNLRDRCPYRNQQNRRQEAGHEPD